MSKTIDVEVVLATALHQQVRRLCLAPGTTAQQAVETSGLLDLQHPLVLGGYGRLLAADAVLKSGDRVELLQPLWADPKDARRARVKAARRRRAAT